MGLQQIMHKLPTLRCQKASMPSCNTLAISALTLLQAGAENPAKSCGRLVMWENVSM